LTKEYERKKAELQSKIRTEEARYRNVPGLQNDAHREILALQNELEQLEVQYSRELEKRKVK